MGRFCKICGRSRPNEQFGGKGLRAVICKKCRAKPKVERDRILVTDEVLGFLEQSNISAKNIKRLHALDSIDDAPFQRLRLLVLDIALCKPNKKRRWKVLRETHPDLFHRLTESDWFDYLIDDGESSFELMDEVISDTLEDSPISNDWNL